MALVASLVPLLILMSIALVIDVRERRIPNWLTGLVFVTGMTNAVWNGHPTSVASALLGLAVGVAILIVPFIVNAVGGGDFKLLAAIGTWLGPVATLEAYCIAAVAGMTIVLVQCAANGRLTELFRNSTLIVANVVNIDRAGASALAASATTPRTIEKRQPWAVPAFIGVVCTIAHNLI